MLSFTLSRVVRFALFTSLLVSTPLTAADDLTSEQYYELVQEATQGAPKWSLSDSDINGVATLPQDATNGKSSLGSLNAPTYNSFIPSRRRQNTPPWGSRTATGTDMCKDIPNTGAVRSYTFNLTRSILASDGVPKSVMLINGQFPGPTIEANWGDMVEITVLNNLGNEGTSLHWHGLLQNGTNNQDGVPGISQCPIAPGSSYTYKFQADLYGTSWYHAHYSAQYTAGMYGAILIHGPTDNAPYDVDLGPVLLADYYYDDYYSIVEDVMGPDKSKQIPLSDNNLINGKGIANCSQVSSPNCTPNAALARFEFQTGKTHRLRLINAGAEGIQKFSIDNHPLQVIAVDFTPIQPYTTNIVTLGVGQRMDVLVYAGGKPTDYLWMRSTISTCSKYKQPNAFAIINYPAADPNGIPTTTAFPDHTDPCRDDPLEFITPAYPMSVNPAAAPGLTIELDIGVKLNATGSVNWLVNNSTFRADFNNPVLHQLQNSAPVANLGAEQNAYDLGTSNTTRFIINNNTPASHPMHMHGYVYSVLAAGGTAPGSNTTVKWDGTITNPTNPARRDVQILPPNGYIVLQIYSTNPGVWPLHCHIAWHVSAGLYANIVTQTPSIPAWGRNQPEMSSVCAAWNTWTSADTVDQIDSGLRA